MTSFIFKRLINLIPTFFIATFIAWMVIDIAPGDFSSNFRFETVDIGRAERIRQQLGLDQPGYIRYFYWLRNLLFDFDFGQSLASRSDVTALVIPRMINSLRLVLPATILSFLIAIPIGVYSALRKYSIGDRILTVFSLLGLAIPNFFLMLLVVAFAVQWFQANGYFLIPVGGMTSNNYSQLGPLEKQLDFLWHLIGPMLVVALSGLAGISRFMRGEMLEVLGNDYIRTARAKGLSERAVNYKHALRNAIIVIVATIGGILPALINGAGLVEYVARWPGITPLFIRSIISQDIYVVMAFLTIITIFLMLGNLLSDIALAIIDPRIRYS